MKKLALITLTACLAIFMTNCSLEEMAVPSSQLPASVDQEMGFDQEVFQQIKKQVEVRDASKKEHLEKRRQEYQALIEEGKERFLAQVDEQRPLPQGRSGMVIRVPDDYADISDAVAAAAPGTTIQINGTITTTEFFAFASGITFEGKAGGTWNSDAIVLYGDNNTFRNLKFNLAGNYGNLIAKGDQFKFHDNIFSSSAGGFACEGCTNGEIRNNKFAVHYGTSLFGSTDCIFEKNKIDIVGNAPFASGLSVYASHNNQIADNQINGNGANCDGYYFTVSHNNTVDNCIARRCGLTGFFLLASQHNSFNNCSATDGGTNDLGYFYAGFHVIIESTDNTFVACTASRNSWFGFFVGGFFGERDNQFINCKAQNNSSIGFGLLATTGNLVKGGIFSNNASFGLALSNAHGNSIIDNTCNNNGSTGLLGSINADANNNNFFSGNTTNNNSGNGFALSQGSGNTIKGHIANDNAGFGIVLLNGTGNTLTNSIAKDNGRCDMTAYEQIGANEWVVADPALNSFSGNKYGGFYCPEDL